MRANEARVHHRRRVGARVTVFALTRITREEATMFEDRDAWIRRPPRSWRTPSITPHLIELWCVEKDTDQVRGLAMETPVGYALGIDFAVRLMYHPDLEDLITAADRLEAAFLAQGWRALHAHGARKEEA
jgi:hypothetical protein